MKTEKLDMIFTKQWGGGIKSFFFSFKYVAKNGFWQLSFSPQFLEKNSPIFGKYCNKQEKIPSNKL